MVTHIPDFCTCCKNSISLPPFLHTEYREKNEMPKIKCEEEYKKMSRNMVKK
jgi:hypothetical protein